MRLVRVDGDMVAAARNEVNRAEYARFAAATGRAAALCRERLSPLRIVKPISWREPGFQQSPGQPVVCVSWSDADAYARWMSQRTGHRSRLPSTAEARALPVRGGGRPGSEWRRDGSTGRTERMTEAG